MSLSRSDIRNSCHCQPITCIISLSCSIFNLKAHKLSISSSNMITILHYFCCFVSAVVDVLIHQTFLLFIVGFFIVPMIVNGCPNHKDGGVELAYL